MDDHGAIARLAPLVEELGAFCRGHEAGDGGHAATRMRDRVGGMWPDVPERRIAAEHGHEADCEELALLIVVDVGETARRLTEEDEAEVLGWSRANLVFDLEQYLAALEG